MSIAGLVLAAGGGSRYQGPTHKLLAPFGGRPLVVTALDATLEAGFDEVVAVTGAVDFSAALASQAKLLGYHVTICDARGTFATPARFPMADEVVVGWPQRYLEAHGEELGPRDACCVLTHDPKFDIPAVLGALRTRVGYLGAMGSRRTQAQRAERLREAGCSDADLARLMAPIGLDLGARTPEETAVAILAEILLLRSGREGGSLRDASGPIHQGLEPIR